SIEHYLLLGVNDLLSNAVHSATFALCQSRTSPPLYVFFYFFKTLLSVISVSSTTENVKLNTVSYSNYKVYSLIPQNERQTTAIQDLFKNPKGLDFWTYGFVKGRPVLIMSSDEKYPVLETFIKEHGCTLETVIPNVQKLIDAQRDNLFLKTSNPNESALPILLIDCPYLTSIYEFLDLLISQHSPHATAITLGNSYQGRPIRGVQISYKSNNPGVFLEAGTHAREWIAPATALYILYELLTKNYDWYIFPSVNPDGYEYSHKVDRLWRKNRRPVEDSCVGVDPNRNFDIHWTDGTGDGPCEETYPGPNAFSEPETKNLAEFVKSKAKNIQVYLDFHSYSQLLMFPYGYTPDHAPNYDQLLRIGKKAAAALESVYGTQYEVGDIAEVIYTQLCEFVLQINICTRLDKIYEFLDSLIYHFPYATPITLGNSYEGRPIRGVKISYKSNNPGVFLESGTHAREWIAPATALFILNELLTSEDKSVRFIAENYDWYIFPSVNPDGYEYSHQVNRLWRKNRRPVTEWCFGVDMNRNFDINWSAGEYDPCRQTYPGPNAFSEPETKNLANFVMSIANNIQVYLSLHSYSQLLMFPYAYTHDHTPNHDEL
ncbi:hypothetical protein L9F63_016090, partial [Diploptera punctata]